MGRIKKGLTLFMGMVIVLSNMVFIKAYAAESNNTVTIYPNGRKTFFGLFRTGDPDVLMLGDAQVIYEVDEENNTVNISLDKEVFIDDVVSEGETLHNSVRFNNDEVLEVNKDLKTEGFMSAGVRNIELKYDDVNAVDQITLMADLNNIDDWIGLFDSNIIENSELLNAIDNDINTFDTIGSSTKYEEKFIYLNKEIDLKAFRIKVNSDGCRIVYYSSDGKSTYNPVLNNFKNGEIGNITTFKNVNKIGIAKDTTKTSLRVYEVEIYGKVVSNLEFKNVIENVDYNKVNFDFVLENDDGSINFIIKVYRDDIYVSDTQSLNFTDYNLDSDTEYTYKFELLVDNEIHDTVENTIRTKELPPPPPRPSKVRNITAQKKDASMLLSWIPNPENENVVKYNIYLDGEKKGETQDAEYEITGLEKDKNYVAAVTAQNEVGESSLSTISISTMDNIDIDMSNIFQVIAGLFIAIWPLLAFSIALLVFPKVIRSGREAIK